MATIGEQLRAAREAKGVSQSDAASATKILTKLIVSMEADDFSVMAAPTYAKGFIRLYAQYLGLDSEPLIEKYTENHAGGPRRLIDESSQLEQNTQDSRVFPARPNLLGKVSGSLPKIPIRNVPLGPLKDIRVAAGVVAGLIVLAVLISLISTCARKNAAEKQETKKEIYPARMLLDEPLPDLYLTEPGKIEAN
jgi:transcriptional regulator with XRE-family HTH domain